MMTELFTYLTYAGLGLTAFYTVYFLLLRRSTLFLFNRIYLLATFALAFILPAINIPWLSRQAAPAAATGIALSLPAVENTGMASAADTHWYDAFWEALPTAAICLYMTGLVYLLLRLGIGIYKIYRLKRSSNPTQSDKGIIVYRSAKVEAPSSFIHAVFLPESLPNDKMAEAILRHEQVHVRQLHSVDVLFIEIGLALQWFNPIAWAYRYSIREVHEYLADEASIDKSSPVATARRYYQKTLLAYCLGQPPHNLTHTFSQPTLKNRIMMMNKRRNKATAALRALVALPVCLALLMLWAENADAQVSEMQTAAKKSATAPIYVVDGIIVPSADHIDPDDIKTIDVTGDPETVSAYGGSEGQKVIKIVLKDGTEEYLTDEEKEEIKVVISPTEGTQQELEEKFEEVKIIKTGDSYPPPLYIINGKEVKNFKTVNPDNIATMEVLKGEKATEKYGVKGENGVVEIVLKKGAKSKKAPNNQPIPDPNPEPESDPNRTPDADVDIDMDADADIDKDVEVNPDSQASEADANPTNGQPVFVIDGIVSESPSTLTLDPKQIKKVKVLKGKKAHRKYGKKGAINGVVEITTRR